MVKPNKIIRDFRQQQAISDYTKIEKTAFTTATVLWVTKSQTWLKRQYTHTHNTYTHTEDKILKNKFDMKYAKSL